MVKKVILVVFAALVAACAPANSKMVPTPTPTRNPKLPVFFDFENTTVMLNPPNQMEVWVRSDRGGWSLLKVQIKEAGDDVNVCVEGYIERFQIIEMAEGWTEISISPDYDRRMKMKRCYIVPPSTRIYLAGR